MTGQPWRREERDALVLRVRVQAGAKRTETSAGSKTYADADAIRILDAWWPLLVKAEFQPGLGSDLYTAFSNNLPVDESPSAAHGPRRKASS